MSAQWAVELMTRTVGKHDVAEVNFVRWTKSCRCGWERKVGPEGMDADEWDRAHREHQMAEALSALTSPQSVSCEDCGGSGHLPAPTGPNGQTFDVLIWCPPCAGDGVRVLPAIAVLRDELVQMAWATRGAGVVGAYSPDDDWDYWNAGWHPLFRLSDPVPSPQSPRRPVR